MNAQIFPYRRLVLFLLVSCGVIAAMTEVTFFKVRLSFPAWFGPIFLAGVVFFIGMIAFYFHSVLCTNEAELPDRGVGAGWIWGLLIISVVCTSSLHQLAPFRPDILREWSQVPSFLKFIKYNFVFTATMLVAVIALAAGYFSGCRRFAWTGLLVLAGMMLVPNDDCRNDFNRPWIAWLGASPLMFLSNSVVLLIGYCGLQGIRPRISALMMGLINAGVLLLGLGHWTRVVW